MYESKNLKREDILFPELSYKIIGCAFDVYNELGAGHHEKYYQRALAAAFHEANLKFYEQKNAPLKYKGKIIGKGYLDFLVNDEIIIEIKKGDRFSHAHISQVLEYLKIDNKKLAILINFSSKGVISKRIVNINNS